MNFRGQKAFSSTAGIILSLVVRVSILLFALTRGLSMLQKPDEFLQITENQMNFEDVRADAGSMTWDAMNFDFMVGFDRLLSLDVGRITMELLTYENDILVSSDPLPSGLCDYEHQGLTAAERDLGLIFGDDFTLNCPKSIETIALTGNTMTPTFQTIQVKFNRCKSTETITCLTDQEIESFIENSRLVMFSPRNHL